MIGKPNDLDPRSIRYKWRKRRFALIEQLIKPAADANGRVSIIDIGGTRRYWNLLEPKLAPRCTVTLVNFEAWMQPHKLGSCNNGIEFIEHVGDGCDLSEFSDGAFDLAHSNSVIEHVGGLARMIPFAEELRRVGQSYFCQTPYLWFPIEPHHGVPFYHWLPGPTRARLLHRHKVGWRPRAKSYEEALQRVTDTQLVDAYLMRGLFPDATIRKERVMFMTKSLMAVRALR